MAETENLKTRIGFFNSEDAINWQKIWMEHFTNHLLPPAATDVLLITDIGTREYGMPYENLQECIF